MSLQLGGGDWDQAMDALRRDPSVLHTPQLAQQEYGATGSSGGSVLANADEVARQSNNPLGGDFILWLNFFDLDAERGDITDQDRYTYSHLFQPVIPIRMPQIGENWIWVNRPSIPTTINRELAVEPDPQRPDKFRFDNRGGFGDVEYFALLGTSTPTDTGWAAETFGVGDTVLAGGFTTIFPTGRKSLSQNVYGAGPAATAAYVGKDWTLANLVQHWWHYEKQSGADDYNFTRLQLFYFKSLPDGWQIGGTPKITADWSASGDDRWTVPIGIAAFKTVLLGEMPVKFGAEFRPSLTRPDSLGTDWQVEFSVIPVTPNFVAKWLR